MSRWLLSVGHGYSAKAFAASLPEDWRIRATARTPERAAELRATGVEPVAWEDNAALTAAAGEAEAVLVSVPPRATGDLVLPRIGAALAASPGCAGSVICRRPASMATGRAAGSMRRPSAGR